MAGRRIEAIRVEVIYALPGGAEVAALRLPPGATVRDALERAGRLPLGAGKVGIFGRVAALDAKLADGDRVEIYRPLAIDPKEARRRRAAKRRSGGG
jgi:putative ubiquitin-RnfH superfamily antitoxin RatB of RatAB toxin-antitoxin module